MKGSERKNCQMAPSSTVVERSEHALEKDYRFPNWPLFALFLMLLLITGLGVWNMHARSTPLWGTEKVARTTRDVPAYTVIDETNAEEVEVFAPDDDAVSLEGAVGQVVATPTERETVLTEENLVTLPTRSREWRVLTVPLPSTVPPATGEIVVLLGVDAANASPIPASAPKQANGGAETSVVIAEEAFVLGTTNGRVVVAVTPEEAQRAITYLTGKEHQILVFRSLDVPE